MAKNKPIFQFSSFDNRELASKLADTVIRLGGRITQSLNYEPKATHLIIEKMDNTEKLFCFAASGKSVLLYTYIIDSGNENKFLDEAEYHVSKFFHSSKLAQASAVWSELNSKSHTLQPFYNWRVACFFNEAVKADALIRIIDAGGGKATHVSDEITHLPKNFIMTLVISDPAAFESAKRLALRNKVPCYPFQCIADYLMQAVKNDRPILPLKYYESTKVIQASPPIKGAKKLPHFPLNTLQQTTTFKAPIFQDITENHLENFWANHVYLMAMKVLEKDKLLSPTWMANMLTFLLESSTKIKAALNKFATASCPVDMIYTQTYQEIYIYLHDCILQYPPVSNESIKYYSSVFTSLGLTERLVQGKGKSTNLRGLIDVMFLMCIHDHLLHKSLEFQKAFWNSSLLKSLLISDENLGLIIRLALKDKSIPKATYLKLIQIMDFCNTNYVELGVYERFGALYDKNVESDDYQKGSVTIEQVLESILNEIQLNHQ